MFLKTSSETAFIYQTITHQCLGTKLFWCSLQFLLNATLGGSGSYKSCILTTGDREAKVRNVTKTERREKIFKNIKKLLEKFDIK